MIIEITLGILAESVRLTGQMSPYLLFGFFFAGVLHIFFPFEFIARHLGKSGFWSVIKAVVLGIPLPLCSCGVIPAAVALRKKGASRGAIVSFLTATPITGVDSILATYSLLGIFFAVFRVIASTITAIVAGLLTNLLPSTHYHPGDEKEHEGEHCHHCAHDHEGEDEHPRGKIRELFHYAFVELIEDIWKWLLLGILIAGAISYLMPETFIQKYLGTGWQAMIVMLIIGIPMYVCATGSIPIAASLMLKGMNPGAALVFLLAGPATNAVTITVVANELGKVTATVYVGTIAVMSIVMGMILNAVWGWLGWAAPSVLAPMEMLPHWFETTSLIILVALTIFQIITKLVRK